MEYTARRGEVCLTAETLWVGEDLCVVVTGGAAHIGSVSAATPRPSLSDPAVCSATVSTMNYVSHKDDYVGNSFAQALSARLGTHVVVLCGIHFDGASPARIAEVERLSKELLAQLLAAHPKK